MIIILILIIITKENINPRTVEMTPTSFIPGYRVIYYAGRVNLHFIKESFTIKEQGGLGGFTHMLLNEVNAIVRSHVASLGGNAVLGYKIDVCNIMENVSKNQVKHIFYHSFSSC